MSILLFDKHLSLVSLHFHGGFYFFVLVFDLIYVYIYIYISYHVLMPTKVNPRTLLALVKLPPRRHSNASIPHPKIAPWT